MLPRSVVMHINCPASVVFPRQTQFVMVGIVLKSLAHTRLINFGKRDFSLQ